MPRNVIGNAPYPVRTIDSDNPITFAQLADIVGTAEGASICLRSATGHQNRGGYFFHFRPHENDFKLLDFVGHEVVRLSPEHLAKFINHASGRVFDEEMLIFSQSVVNLRQDQIAP
jgi:hypothetical protein